MIGRTNTGGGGGGLNFRVVGGTTAPSNPRENTIWINTATKITSWTFSTTEPSSAEDGMVWITVGTASSVAFSATKKNPIMVYPLSAKQRVGGAWASVTAMTYQDGWVEWVRYLVGANGIASELGDSKYIGYYGNLYTTVTPLPNGGVKITAAGGSGYIAHTFENAINVTAYSKMKVKTGAVVSSGVNIGLSKNNNDVSIAYNKDVSKNITSNSNIELDISAISGDYYLVIGFNNYQDSTRSAEILEITLES